MGQHQILSFTETGIVKCEEFMHNSFKKELFMRKCPTCQREKKWSEFAGCGSCRECNKKPCPICGIIFCPTGKKTHCSIKCNLLGNIKKTEKGCWEWQKKLDKNGYGRVNLGKEKGLALVHRLSYEVFKGNFDLYAFVCHDCDNPCCINPDHLFLGTQQDNVNDCYKKGRMFPIRSVSHLRGKKVSRGGKLSPHEVMEIRKLRIQGIPRKKIAEKFNITPEFVYKICKKIAWEHVE